MFLRKNDVVQKNDIAQKNNVSQKNDISQKSNLDQKKRCHALPTPLAELHGDHIAQLIPTTLCQFHL